MVKTVYKSGRRRRLKLDRTKDWKPTYLGGFFDRTTIKEATCLNMEIVLCCFLRCEH